MSLVPPVKELIGLVRANVSGPPASPGPKGVPVVVVPETRLCGLVDGGNPPVAVHRSDVGLPGPAPELRCPGSPRGCSPRDPAVRPSGRRQSPRGGPQRRCWSPRSCPRASMSRITAASPLILIQWFTSARFLESTDREAEGVGEEASRKHRQGGGRSRGGGPGRGGRRSPGPCSQRGRTQANPPQ